MVAGRPARRTGATAPQAAPAATNTRVLRSHTAAQAAAAPFKVIKPKPKARRRRLDPWAPKRKPNPNPKPRAPPRTRFTCRICVEEQPKSEFPEWFRKSDRRRWLQIYDVPFECIAHLAVSPGRRKGDPVCKTCIGRTMAARLDQLGARQVGVGCGIESGCQVRWNWDYVMRYMPGGEALEKFNMEMFEVWRQDVAIKPFTCIAPGCGAVGLPDPTAPGYPQISCNTCGHRSCSLCEIPWHKDLTCAEHRAQHVNEKMTDPEKDTLKLMQTKDGKRCPNCQLVIEKDGGCDSMYCIGCHKYFNWATAASAVPGAKKADTVVSHDPYGHYAPPGPVICEMDALERANNTIAAAA